MPPSPDQPDPKQAVEARLCAYLEGDLSGDELAQIERHLAANPQHRKLLVELSSVRTWTRQLPREPAPPDLADAFQQQVERSMLLDPAGDRRRAIGWRGVRLAALLLIAVGLATVAVVLARGGRLPLGRDVAVRTSPATLPVVTGRAGRLAQQSKVAAAPPRSDPPPGAAAKPDSGPPTFATGSSNLVTPTAPEDSTLADRVAAEQPPADHRVLGLVAVTPTPAATAAAATAYLSSRHLSWTDRPLTADAGGSLGSPAPQASQQSAQQQLPSPPPAAAVSRQQNDTQRGNATPAVGGLQQRAADPYANNLNRNAVAPAARPPAALPPAGRLLIVRDLSPEQARDLTAILSAAATVRTVDLPPTPGAPRPTTAIAADPRRVTLVAELRSSSPTTRP